MTVGNSTTRSSRMWLLMAVSALVLVLGVVRGASTPFWFDEISTVRIAQMPTWGDAFRGTQTLDLNPPLEVMAVRASMRLLGPHELAGHLPSILGFAIAAACLFLLVARRAPAWFAAFAALLLVQNSEVFYYATEARPYALLLAFLGLALLGYDNIVRGKGSALLARILLFLGLSGMLLTHVFAVFAVGAFLGAEFVRSLRRKRIDALTWLALLAPLACCVLYPPLLRSHGVMLYPPVQRPTLASGLRFYIYILIVPSARVLGASLVLLLFYRSFPQISFFSWIDLPLEEWALLLVLLATPVTTALIMLARSPLGGFYARYSLGAFFPALFLLAVWIAWRCRGNLVIARLLTVIVLVGVAAAYHDVPAQALHLMRHGWLSAPDQAASTGGVDKIHPELPLVAGDGLEFLEADYRLDSADLKRFYYLTDTPTALRLSHSNALEYLPSLKVPFHVRANFASLSDFTAQHRQFLVIGDLGRSTSWLLPWAMEQHADLCYLGNYDYAGSTLPLWMVTLKPTQ